MQDNGELLCHLLVHYLIWTCLLYTSNNTVFVGNNQSFKAIDIESQDILWKYNTSDESIQGAACLLYTSVVADTLTSVNRLVGYVSAAIILILLVVSVFLISNTVTMGVTVRREEIAIMKYIGAKDGFVRAPFVFEGLLIGVIGALIPLVLLYFMYGRAVEYIMTRFSLLRNIIDFLPVTTVYRTLLPIGIALGVGIGFLGSFMTIRKHLRV